MKKDKKSRSRELEHRRHKTSSSHRRRQSGVKERDDMRYRSRSPSSSKRKADEEKDWQNPKQNTEARNDVPRMDGSVDIKEEEKVCYGLEGFINDNEKMIQEIFDAVSEENLKKMTPDSLKNCPLEELKKMCLEELKHMTNAEIIYILSGKDPASFEPFVKIDEAEDCDLIIHAEDENKNSNLHMKAEAAHGSPSPSCEKMSELQPQKSISAEDDQGTPAPSGVGGNAKSESESDSLELCATQKEIDSLIHEEILFQSQSGTQRIEQQTKSELTDMEILELELRARIIRSLLKRQGLEISDDDGVHRMENTQMKEENTSRTSH